MRLSCRKIDLKHWTMPVGHLLFQLLNESEATVLRLTEQASVLKGEIRRLERNQERENAISNMEYLKNIVYKVCCSESCYASFPVVNVCY